MIISSSCIHISFEFLHFRVLCKSEADALYRRVAANLLVFFLGLFQREACYGFCLHGLRLFLLQRMEEICRDISCYLFKAQGGSSLFKIGVAMFAQTKKSERSLAETIV